MGHKESNKKKSWFFCCLHYLFQIFFRQLNSLDPDQARLSVGPDLDPNWVDSSISVSNSLDPDQAWLSVGSDRVQTVCKDHQHPIKFAASRQELMRHMVL